MKHKTTTKVQKKMICQWVRSFVHTFPHSQTCKMRQTAQIVVCSVKYGCTFVSLYLSDGTEVRNSKDGMYTRLELSHPIRAWRFASSNMCGKFEIDFIWCLYITICDFSKVYLLGHIFINKQYKCRNTNVHKYTRIIC